MLRLLLTLILTLGVLLAGVTPAAESAADLYQAYCSVCHGESGDGQSRARFGLNPPPTDFTQPGLKASLSAESMIRTVTHGRPGTAMVAWKSRLSAEQIAAIVAYIREQFMIDTAARESTAVEKPNDKAGLAANTKAPRGDMVRGQALYAQNCVACHGLQGKGKGPRADFIFPKPRDFTSGTPLSREELYVKIRDGIVGKEMPAWGKVMTDKQLRDVTEYVYRSFMEERETD